MFHNVHIFILCINNLNETNLEHIIAYMKCIYIENAISHVHVNKRSLGLVTTILAVLQNTLSDAAAHSSGA